MKKYSDEWGLLWAVVPLSTVGALIQVFSSFGILYFGTKDGKDGDFHILI